LVFKSDELGFKLGLEEQLLLPLPAHLVTAAVLQEQSIVVDLRCGLRLGYAGGRFLPARVFEQAMDELRVDGQVV